MRIELFSRPSVNWGVVSVLLYSHCHLHAVSFAIYNLDIYLIESLFSCSFFNKVILRLDIKVSLEVSSIQNNFCYVLKDYWGNNKMLYIGSIQ